MAYFAKRGMNNSWIYENEEGTVSHLITHHYDIVNVQVNGNYAVVQDVHNKTWLYELTDDCSYCKRCL